VSIIELTLGVEEFVLFARCNYKLVFNQIGQTKDVCNMGWVKVNRAIAGDVGLGVQRCNAGISLHSNLSVSGANVCDKCRVAKGAINAGTGVQKHNVAKTINLSRASLERSWVVAEDRLLCMAVHSGEGGQVSLHIKKLEALPISCTLVVTGGSPTPAICRWGTGSSSCGPSSRGGLFIVAGNCGIGLLTGTNRTFYILVPIILGNHILLGTVLGDVARLATSMADSSRNSIRWGLIRIALGSTGSLSKTCLLRRHRVVRVGSISIVVIIIAALPILLLGFKVIGVMSVLVQSINGHHKGLGVLVIVQ